VKEYFGARKRERSRGRAMVARWFIFKPKNPDLGKFWGAFVWNIFIHFMASCNILEILEIY
jgi:hypothetical protein